MKEEFVSHVFGVQYSWYNWNSTDSFKTFYWTNGLNFSYTNNFGDLTKLEISETQEFGTTLGERNSTTKFNVYTGDYKEKIKGVELYSDFYYFLFHNNQAAFHIYPQYVFLDNLKPRLNFGLGLLFAFKDVKKENKSIVNAELYYNFLDLFKSTDTDYKLFERNDIGIRLTFPINFLNKI